MELRPVELLLPVKLVSGTVNGVQVIARYSKGRFYLAGTSIFSPEITSEEIRLDSYTPVCTPSQVIGIGLNYKEHAQDLSVPQPNEYPVLFYKPTYTMIGPSESIRLPTISSRVTGEAELGIVVGKDCRNINEADWLEYVAGFITVLDMTAEDILRKNTRYLGLSKIFPTFLSLGAELITPDEFTDLGKVQVSTVLNGQVMGTNIVDNMRYSPAFLLSFVSSIIPLRAGDVISTGTPRAAVLSHGDVLEAVVDGFLPHRNPVHSRV